MSGYRKYTAVFVLIAASAALAGCATPVDENLQHAQMRMQAARADATLRAEAGGPLADAARTLEQAQGTEDVAVRHHFLYMTEKNLDIAEAIVARKGAEREIEALRRRQEEARKATPPADRTGPPAGAVPSVAATNLVREMERERLETAIREAREAQARAEKMERTLERLETREPARPDVQTVTAVHFAAGTAALSPGAQRSLEPLVVRLRNDDALHVIVEGYTDNSGTHEANLQVSLARARAVKSYLVEQGISEDRVLTLGLGADYPVASNETADGRRQNRRVQIVLDRVGADADPAAGAGDGVAGSLQ